MSKLERLIKELCPEGVDFVELGAISEIYDGTHQTPKYIDDGVKFVSVENINNLYETKKYISYDDFSKYKAKPRINDLLMTRIGTIGVCTVVDRDEELAYYVTLALIRPNVGVNPKYLKYAIESKNGRKELRKRTLINAVPIKINLGDIGRIKLPIPPLAVQCEIVRILDNFTELTTDLTAQLTVELTARKQQYEYYRNKLLTQSGEAHKVELKTVVKKSCSGGTPTKGNSDYYENGTIPWLRTQDVKFNEIYEINNFITEEAVKKTSAKWIPANCVIVAISGATAGRCAINKIATTTNQHCLNMEIDNTKALYKYIYYCVCSQYEELISRKQGARGDLNSTLIMGIEIPLPTLKEQEHIIAILERFDNIVNEIIQRLNAEIEARQKQYEYYHDKLLTFKEI